MSKVLARVQTTRKTVKAAIACIEAHAEALRESHTIIGTGEWPPERIDQQAKREYLQMRGLLEALREIQKPVRATSRRKRLPSQRGHRGVRAGSANV